MGEQGYGHLLTVWAGEVVRCRHEVLFQSVLSRVLALALHTPDHKGAPNAMQWLKKTNHIVMNDECSDVQAKADIEGQTLKPLDNPGPIYRQHQVI